MEKVTKPTPLCTPVVRSRWTLAPVMVPYSLKISRSLSSSTESCRGEATGRIEEGCVSSACRCLRHCRCARLQGGYAGSHLEVLDVEVDALELLDA